LFFDVAYFLETNEFAAFLTWIKPAVAGKYYPAGFQMDIFGRGFLYTSSSVPLIPVTNAIVAFSGGNLADPFQNEVTIAADNKLENNSANPLTITIIPSSGLFRGTVTPPGETKPFRFNGLLFQQQDDAGGYGYFLGTNQSGRVRLLPSE
jgi:hypothetical protein